MVDKIYEIKNHLLEQVEQEMRERPDRMDGEKIDMIKDLAQAEKECWQAEYYRSVVEAMEGQSGYDGSMMGYSGGSSGGSSSGSRGGGSSSGGGGGRSGWQNQYGSGRGGSRRGYGMSGHTEAMESLKMAMQNAGPEERERLTQELRTMMGGMM